ncbi:hypothetical protein CGCSCA4_v010185 [Colletotrichum siamense]|uniref:Uncharacterized protein n=1 Tax=Colletotrichum siamense TaxID=690259 RepID=A0A9P5ENC3_COLSI|nr:hypothetical protein CGCSCA4_v010185 [Colletotrichum siamense]KAF4855347.1 hypothetical protein CGCSCA2_v009126 [Colletotrichum siamense]
MSVSGAHAYPYVPSRTAPTIATDVQQTCRNTGTQAGTWSTHLREPLLPSSGLPFHPHIQLAGSRGLRTQSIPPSSNGGCSTTSIPDFHSPSRE